VKPDVTGRVAVSALCELEVRHVGRRDRPHELEVVQIVADAIEQSFTAAEESRHEMDFYFVDEAGRESDIEILKRSLDRSYLARKKASRALPAATFRREACRFLGRGPLHCHLAAVARRRLPVAPPPAADAGLRAWRPFSPCGPAPSSVSQNRNWVFSPMVETPLPSYSQRWVRARGDGQAIPSKVVDGP
jgi:hypothetical protein